MSSPTVQSATIPDSSENLYAFWESLNLFACDPQAGTDTERFCLMMPPPNVTGSLHMGHALTFTLQDILVRWQRMRGRDTLWQPGTDHAGIATQMVVERMLGAKGRDRRSMGREAFLEEVWKWKAESGGAITHQLRKLGVSADWSREKFTLDADLSRAVAHAFVELYRAGLIYRDTRMVNWDPKLQTAVSDLEVDQREIKGKLYTIKYPLNDGSDHILVATTRPETMFGDAAVAVHPENERWTHLIGRMVRLPLTERLIPIIADTYADPEKGTGAVKITPAHDFNDYEVWLRHRHTSPFQTYSTAGGVPEGGLITVFNENGHLGGNEVPHTYQNEERFKARERIVQDLEAHGLLEKIESYTHTVPHGDRSGVPLEPRLTRQWYCDAPKLGEEALKAVEDGRTRFVPEQWANTYFAWLRDLKPWCISRQLWWGHRIPVWYSTEYAHDDDGISAWNVGDTPPTLFVAETTEAAKAQAAKHYGVPIENIHLEANFSQAWVAKKQAPADHYWIYQDEDVLDTWFSSALWPFSTLGWPNKTPDLARYYPTDVLITGFDIIFFWVARMMMMGLYFMKDVPFRTVYIHALVRDAKGQKMSKTKGNVIDPLDVIAEYGCDALRFTLASLATPGRDIRLATSRIASSRNFITKLRNAVRFADKYDVSWNQPFDPKHVVHTLNRWIVGEFKTFAETLNANLFDYRFDLAAQSAYDFVWNMFCDWYIEFSKPILNDPDSPYREETQATMGWVLKSLCIVLHPILPYVTQELVNAHALMLPLPERGRWLEEMTDVPVDAAAQEEMRWVSDLIATLRTLRAELGVPASTIAPMEIEGASSRHVAWIASHRTTIERLGRVSEIRVAESRISTKDAVRAPLGDVTLVLPFGEVIDLDRERARLDKEIARAANDLTLVSDKLADANFTARAPAHVLDDYRSRQEEAHTRLSRLNGARKSIEEH